MGIFLDLMGWEPADRGGGDTVRRIAAEFDKLEPARAKFLASFAFVLSRVANADRDVSAEEVATIEGLVVKGGVSPEQAALVVQMARTQQKLFGATDDFLVTRALAGLATDSQKLAVVECLYAVAAADKRIFNSEADEIARIGKELKVDPVELSRLRSQYREFLEARKGLPSAG